MSMSRALRFCLSWMAWIGAAYACLAAAQEAPALMLADVFQENTEIEGWVMSEKLDGVRAYWDGARLISRQGNVFRAPPYFTHGFPPFPVDGELFSRRGEFERIAAIVRSGEDKGWHSLKLHVFDVPQAPGDLRQRLGVLEKYLQERPAAHITVIPQYPVGHRAHLQAFLQAVEQQGGEGVIVRDPAAPYTAGRSRQMLKLKRTLDDECTVVAHHAGKGRHQGRLGALSCRNARGVFRIGAGFSDADRENPPPIGSLITYRHRGFTKNGIPRFAAFWRVRADAAAGHAAMPVPASQAENQKRRRDADMRR